MPITEVSLDERDVIALVHNFEVIIDDIELMRAEELKILLTDLKERREWLSHDLVLEAFDWLTEIALRRQDALGKDK